MIGKESMLEIKSLFFVDSMQKQALFIAFQWVALYLLIVAREKK